MPECCPAPGRCPSSAAHTAALPPAASSSPQSQKCPHAHTITVMSSAVLSPTQDGAVGVFPPVLYPWQGQGSGGGPSPPYPRVFLAPSYLSMGTHGTGPTCQDGDWLAQRPAHGSESSMSAGEGNAPTPAGGSRTCVPPQPPARGREGCDRLCTPPPGRSLPSGQLPLSTPGWAPGRFPLQRAALGLSTPAHCQPCRHSPLATPGLGPWLLLPAPRPATAWSPAPRGDSAPTHQGLQPRGLGCQDRDTPPGVCSPTCIPSVS